MRQAEKVEFYAIDPKTAKLKLISSIDFNLIEGDFTISNCVVDAENNAHHIVYNNQNQTHSLLSFAIDSGKVSSLKLSYPGVGYFQTLSYDSTAKNISVLVLSLNY